MRMSSPRVFFLAVSAVLLSLGQVGAALAARTNPLGGTGGGPIDGYIQVRVVHEGTTNPFEGAFVMVGPSPGSPIANNWGFTADTGEIIFSDPALQGSVSVTVGATEHQYFTLVSVNASDLVIPLRPVSSEVPVYQVGDNVSGIDVDNGPFHAGDGNVDMAFVLPALKLADVMSFNVESLLGPPEIIEILGEQFEIPSNFYIPQQWELFIEIIKDHYYLYLPAGDFTLTALSGRIPLDALLGGGVIQELLPLFNWREIDILDVTISGNTNNADLHVDPDLGETVTLNLANIHDGSIAWCISAGDLDNRAGLGRLIPLGLNSLDCPGGSGPCGGTVHLTTTAAVGEFAGMVYFPVVAVQLTDSDDMLVLMDRVPRTQTYTADMESFFEVLDLAYSEGEFTWNDVENPGTGSPAVHVQLARIAATDSDDVYWEFMLPGGELSLEAPLLPAEAPPGPVEGSIYAWGQLAFGLGYDLSSFDFNDFAFADILAHASHLALDQTEITFQTPADIASGDLYSAASLRTGWPNPFNIRTTVHYELRTPAHVDLAVCGLDGRKVTILAAGQAHAGNHQAIWRGTDAHGRPVPSGLYLVRLQLGHSVTTQRVLLLR